jgi:hypothetical protein
LAVYVAVILSSTSVTVGRYRQAVYRQPTEGTTVAGNEVLGYMPQKVNVNDLKPSGFDEISGVVI